MDFTFDYSSRISENIPLATVREQLCNDEKV